MAAIVATRCNPHAKIVYEQLRQLSNRFLSKPLDGIDGIYKLASRAAA
jgi:hypothetical protein